MKRILYYLKIIFMALLMSMAAFGMVMPGTFATRKRYADKDITIEQVESMYEDDAIEVLAETED